MANRRDEVIAALRSFGLSDDEVEEELSFREAEAERILEDADEADRPSAMREAREHLFSKEALYIVPRRTAPRPTVAAPVAPTPPPSAISTAAEKPTTATPTPPARPGVPTFIPVAQAPIQTLPPLSPRAAAAAARAAAPVAPPERTTAPKPPREAAAPSVSDAASVAVATPTPTPTPLTSMPALTARDGSPLVFTPPPTPGPAVTPVVTAAPADVTQPATDVALVPPAILPPPLRDAEPLIAKAADAPLTVAMEPEVEEPTAVVLESNEKVEAAIEVPVDIIEAPTAPAVVESAVEPEVEVVTAVEPVEAETLETSAVEPSPVEPESPVAEQPAVEAPVAIELPAMEPPIEQEEPTAAIEAEIPAASVAATEPVAPSAAAPPTAVEVAAIVQVPAVIQDAPAAEVLPDAAPLLFDTALAKTMAEPAAPVEELSDLLEPQPDTESLAADASEAVEDLEPFEEKKAKPDGPRLSRKKRRELAGISAKGPPPPPKPAGKGLPVIGGVSRNIKRYGRWSTASKLRMAAGIGTPLIVAIAAVAIAVFLATSSPDSNASASRGGTSSAGTAKSLQPSPAFATYTAVVQSSLGAFKIDLDTMANLAVIPPANERRVWGEQMSSAALDIKEQAARLRQLPVPICVGNSHTRLLVGVASLENAANGVIAALTGTNADGFNIATAYINAATPTINAAFTEIKATTC